MHVRVAHPLPPRLSSARLLSGFQNSVMRQVLFSALLSEGRWSTACELGRPQRRGGGPALRRSPTRWLTPVYSTTRWLGKLPLIDGSRIPQPMTDALSEGSRV